MGDDDGGDGDSVGVGDDKKGRKLRKLLLMDYLLGK